MLVAVCEKFSSKPLAECLVVGHDSFRGGNNEDAEAFCWQVSFFEELVVLLGD